MDEYGTREKKDLLGFIRERASSRKDTFFLYACIIIVISLPLFGAGYILLYGIEPMALLIWLQSE